MMLLTIDACLQDVGRFRIFGTRMQQMPGWCSDLKHAAALGSSVWHLWKPKQEDMLQLRKGGHSQALLAELSGNGEVGVGSSKSQFLLIVVMGWADVNLVTQPLFFAGLEGRPTWLAANTQPGEEAVVGVVHARLASSELPGGYQLECALQQGTCSLS